MMVYDQEEGIVKFSYGTECVKYIMPRKNKNYKGMDDLDVDNIPAFEVGWKNKVYYTACLELGPEYIRDERRVKEIEWASKIKETQEYEYESSYKTLK